MPERWQEDGDKDGLQRDMKKKVKGGCRPSFFKRRIFQKKKREGHDVGRFTGIKRVGAGGGMACPGVMGAA